MKPKVKAILIIWVICWCLLWIGYLAVQGQGLVPLTETEAFTMRISKIQIPEKAIVKKVTPKVIIPEKKKLQKPSKPKTKKNYGKYRRLYSSRSSLPVYRYGGVIRTMKVKATAYCQGKTTANGSKVKNWKTIASDWGVLPEGSKFWITELGQDVIFEVADTGGVVKGRKIDIYNKSRAWCVKWGVKKIEINVIRWGKNEEA